jgi:hypothetical protein
MKLGTSIYENSGLFFNDSNNSVSPSNEAFSKIELILCYKKYRV